MLTQPKNFINAIKAWLNGDPLPEGIDWARAYEVAKKHSLSALYFSILKSAQGVSEELLKKAKTQYLVYVSQQIQQDYYADELFQRLREEKIPFAPMKGRFLRALYPEPTLRTSCDVDVFYDKKDKTAVSAILQELGFAYDGDWKKGDVTVEMHDELFVVDEIGYEYYKNVWDRLSTDDGVEYRFLDEDFYVYFLAHSAKHFGHAGFGIRTVLDVYFYRAKKTGLDSEYVDCELEKLGLKTFREKIEKLANAWFGDGQADEETEKIGEYVIRCGVFGTSENRALMKGAGKDANVKNTKARYFFKTLFPPYKAMAAKYPFLKKFPIALPFMWVYKWFEVLFTRREKFKQVTKTYQGMSEEEIALVNDVLNITDIPRI